MFDALDQAKLRMPRNMAATKQFANMWRPNCVPFGAIAMHAVECFWLVDPDIVKDSNLEITLMARLLQILSETIEAPMPHQWSNHCDNATGIGNR